MPPSTAAAMLDPPAVMAAIAIGTKTTKDPKGGATEPKTRAPKITFESLMREPHCLPLLQGGERHVSNRRHDIMLAATLGACRKTLICERIVLRIVGATWRPSSHGPSMTSQDSKRHPSVSPAARLLRPDASGRQAIAYLILGAVLAQVTGACTVPKAQSEPVYTREMVEPIVIERRSDTEITLRYRVRPESGYYSGGVNYEQVGNDLRVVIDRCAVGSDCSPMAKSEIPLDDRWQAEVRLPLQGQRVVVEHADDDVQIYP